MIRKTIYAFALFSIAILISCERTPESLEARDYMQWVTSEKKGFVKYKKVNAVTITSRYLPAAYLAYRQFMNSDKPEISYDSIYNVYRCGLTFQFTIQADKSDKQYGNLKYYDIASEEALAMRVRMLNFSADQFFLLTWNEKQYLPVMNVFEGFDELENKLSFTLVFQIAEFNCDSPPDNFESLSFTFNDELWGLGTNHFLFKNAVFQNKPKLKI